MNKLQSALIAIAFALFVAVGVKTVVSNSNQIQFKDIQIKSTKADLLELQVKYDLLNEDLEEELHSANQDQEKIKQLEDEKKRLESEQERLQRELQAKLNNKAKEAQKLSQVAKSASASASCGHNEYASYIFFKESSCNPKAVNSIGCIGIGQNCPDINGNYWLKQACPNWQTDVDCQIKRFEVYAIARYGSWEKAYNFWLANKWW